MTTETLDKADFVGTFKNRDVPLSATNMDFTVSKLEDGFLV
ncbi:MAG: hypothetical protein ACFFDQ_13055 [Candidatus Thorarchaeota archaeon]